MASIKAAVTAGYAGHLTTKMDGLTLDKAKELASSWMRFKVEKYTTSSGLVTDRPFGRVDVFDDDGRYVTTAWGE